MNSHDKAIADELQINSFTEKKFATANVTDAKGLVINLSSYFLKKTIHEPETETSFYDELDYGNYE